MKSGSSSKLTFGLLLSGNSAMLVLGADKALPDKTKYTLARNIRLVRQALKECEKKRKELVKKYGAPDKMGGHSVLPENAERFDDEWNAILDCEVSLDIRKLEKTHFARLSANEISLLDWMMIE